MSNTNYPNFREGKRNVVYSPSKGKALDLCATINRKYICCNVHVLRSVSNCPFECSYCFLQNYLNDGTIKIANNNEKLLDEVREKIASEPDRLFRIGTWELGDSLALEKSTDSAKKLILGFSGLKNAILELKTKSDQVESILDLNHNQRTVVSWSLNPDYIIKREEHKTARLKQRLEAMKKVQDHGYLIGLHFDPMIFFKGWEEAYKDLISQIFTYIPASKVAWLSIGSLRFNPEMKMSMDINYPGNNLTAAEMITGKDGKMRYPRQIREEMYKLLLAEIYKNDLNKQLLIYLCMEPEDVWKKVMGFSPQSIEELDFIFATSIYQRFENILSTPPLKENYGL